MSSIPPTRILILGGTAEAVDLAAALLARFGAAVQVISSQAGRTRSPRLPVGEWRIGGFGGASGLAAYLAEQRIDLVIDATHPFASRISASARTACRRAGCRRLMLVRPTWRRQPGDDWREAADAGAAAALVEPLGRRVFLTIGRRDLGAFSHLADHWFLVRLVDQPDTPLPLPHQRVITGRGPFSLAVESTLLRAERIDVLVTKASGGEATAAKLSAAREANLPVVMIRRPLTASGEQVDSIPAALAWVANAFDPQRAPL